MDQALKVLSERTAILNPYGKQIPPVVDLARKAKVNEGLILGGILFTAGLLLMLFQGFTILLTSYTVIYPGLLSIKAINSKGKGDDKTWLTYWLIFGLLHVAETFLGFIFYFIPYWSWIRIGLFIWLLQFNGSRMLYDTVLRDLLNQHKDLIKDFISRTQSGVSKVANEAAKEASSAIADPNNMAKLITTAAATQAKINETFEDPQTTSIQEAQ